MRSYQLTCTGSHQNSEVKRVWARVVLGWVTSWEVLVLHSPPPLFLFFFLNFNVSSRGYLLIGRALVFVLSRHFSIIIIFPAYINNFRFLLKVNNSWFIYFTQLLICRSVIFFVINKTAPAQLFSIRSKRGLVRAPGYELRKSYRTFIRVTSWFKARNYFRWVRSAWFSKSFKTICYTTEKDVLLRVDFSRGTKRENARLKRSLWREARGSEPLRGGGRLRGTSSKGQMGAIIPALKHRIPSELRS